MPTGFILVGIFVDDLLVINATGDPNAITELWTALGRYYDVKAETKLTKFLGAEYTELPEGLHLHLNQYITNVLARFNMSTCIAEDLPEPAELDLETPESVALLGKTDKKEFQEITGSCMFAMIACRPDIAHATNMLSRRMNKPRVCDARAARHLLRYLQGTKQHGLFFRYEPLPGTRGSKLSLILIGRKIVTRADQLPATSCSTMGPRSAGIQGCSLSYLPRRARRSTRRSRIARGR
jgi:hypothetical protein